MAVLLDWQFSYRGLVMGADTDIDVELLDNLRGFVGLRQGDVNIPRADGMVQGKHFLGGRTIPIRIVTQETAESAALMTLEQSVETAFQASEDDEFDFEFKRPGWVQQKIQCRPVRVKRPIAHDNERGQTTWVIDLKATDPRIYGVTQQNLVIPLFDASLQGGIDYDVVDYAKNFPEGFAGTGLVDNDGNATAYPICRFSGPTTGTVTGVQLTNLTNGDVLDIDATITSGQLLTADMDAFARATGAQIIGLDGTTRYNDWQLPRSVFGLDPGQNVIKYEITGTSTDATCLLIWFDTWK